MGNQFTSNRNKDNDKTPIINKDQKEKDCKKYNNATNKITTLEQLGMIRCPHCKIYGHCNTQQCPCHTVYYGYMFGMGSVRMY